LLLQQNIVNVEINNKFVILKQKIKRGKGGVNKEQLKKNYLHLNLITGKNNHDKFFTYD
jgi:hypothetical protein